MAAAVVEEAARDFADLISAQGGGSSGIPLSVLASSSLPAASSLEKRSHVSIGGLSASKTTPATAEVHLAAVERLANDTTMEARAERVCFEEIGSCVTSGNGSELAEGPISSEAERSASALQNATQKWAVLQNLHNSPDHNGELVFVDRELGTGRYAVERPSGAVLSVKRDNFRPLSDTAGGFHADMVIDDGAC